MSAEPDATHIRKRSNESGGQKRDLSYPPLPDALRVSVYDNHTHLEIEDGEEGLDALVHLERAESIGVRGVVQVGNDVATSRWSAALAERDPRVLAAVALHPNEAPKLALAGTLAESLVVIDELAAQPRVRAIGETGLDWFRLGEPAAPGGPGIDPEFGRAAQIESFEAHIDIAKRHGLALQIHDRDAHDDVVATLMRVGAPERTVFHCFSGGPELAAICAENGWHLSFAGTVTFRNAQSLRDALVQAPRDLIMVETDAPFLAPSPFRGRPNAPYLIPHTLRSMAETLGVDVAELAAQISATTERVYGSWSTDPAGTDPARADTASPQNRRSA